MKDHQTANGPRACSKVWASRGWRKGTAGNLMRRHSSLAAVAAESEAELAAVEGVSPRAAHTIRAFFDDPAEQITLAALAAAGVAAASGVAARGIADDENFGDGARREDASEQPVGRDESGQHDVEAGESAVLPGDDPGIEALAGRIEKYATAMKLKGLGGKTARTLVDEGLVAGLADLYRLEAGKVAALPTVRTFGAQNAANLIAGIEASKGRSLGRLLFGLNIRHLGGAVGEYLAGSFSDIDATAAASEDQLAEVPGVGPTIAASVRAFFDEDANKAVVEKLRAAGVNFAGPSPAEATGMAAGEVLPATLEDKSIVVTGALESYSREEAAAVIAARGGRTPGSVSGGHHGGCGRRLAGRLQAQPGREAGRPRARRGRLRAPPRHRRVAFSLLGLC